jgi:phenylacetate-coenzyme A ligase PaaK-like adenylate-forming protein
MTWAELQRQDLRKVQAEQLHRFLNDVVYPFSPYYRKLFDAHKIDPRKIKSVGDLKTIPFTSKADLLPTAEEPEKFRQFVITPDPAALRKRARTIMRAIVHGRAFVRRELEREFRPIFMTATTGRSSAPVAFFYSDYDLRNLRTAGQRLIETFQTTTEQRAVNMFPFAPHLAFWQVALGAMEYGLLVLSTGGGKVMGTEGNIAVIERIKPDCIIGIPTFLYHVLRLAAEEGRRWHHISKIVLGGEKAPPGMKRKLIELCQKMGAGDVMVLSTYGFTEARMAWGECPASLQRGADGAFCSSGFHLYPDKEIFEVVNPETGENVGEGESGELVYTCIDGRGSVVLRYRTGDYVDGGVTWEPCPFCKRTVPRIVGAISRASNVKGLNFTKLKGTLVNFNDLQTLLDDVAEIAEWQLEILKRNNDPFDVDELVLHFAPADTVDAKQLEQKIRNMFRQRSEITPNRIESHTIADMVRRIGIETQLKEKRIVDNRPKG